MDFLSSNDHSLESLIREKEGEIEVLRSDENFWSKDDIRPVPWSVIDGVVADKEPWRIENLIPKQGAVILASISGEKKTWVAMEMARSIAEGKNFLGEERFRTIGCNVLYLNCENSISEMQRRGRQLGYTGDCTHKLLFVNRDDVNLAKKEALAWFLAVIEYYKIQVIFIDTFRSVAGSLKEEKAEEVRHFFNQFQALKNKGITTVWLDHHRKPSNLDGKVPKKEHLLGSTDKVASIEVLLMLRSEGPEINMYQRKNRLGIEVPAFQISMKDEETPEGRRTILSFNGELDEQESKKDEAKELIMTVLEDGPKTTKEILQLTSRNHIGSKNTRMALGELVQDGLLDLAKRSRENLYFLAKEEEKAPETGTFNELDKIFDG